MITFEKIIPTEEQIQTLYRLLGERSHKISHEALPSFDDHNSFVQNAPYRAWYLVKDSETFVGSFYITNENTIGVNIDESSISTCLHEIIDKVTTDFSPLPAIKSVRAGQFSLNVAPSNKHLISTLESEDCPLIQLTFGLPKKSG